MKLVAFGFSTLFLAMSITTAGLDGDFHKYLTYDFKPEIYKKTADSLAATIVFNSLCVLLGVIFWFLLINTERIRKLFPIAAVMFAAFIFGKFLSLKESLLV